MLPNTNADQMHEVFTQVSDYFTLLGEPTRLKILYALCESERAVGDIVVQTGSTQANISRHLGLLYRAKILGRRREGTQVYYRLLDENTMKLCKTVCTQVSLRVMQTSVVSALVTNSS
ncbi:MAG: metalloregulator ArsR/SmtB family transcription factor [Herbaspirillum sp.]